MKRYCVEVLTGRWYDGDSEERCIYKSHYFDEADKAEHFRKWMKRKGAEVTSVMDLASLPF